MTLCQLEAVSSDRKASGFDQRFWIARGPLKVTIPQKVTKLQMAIFGVFVRKFARKKGYKKGYVTFSKRLQMKPHYGDTKGTEEARGQFQRVSNVIRGALGVFGRKVVRWPDFIG